MGATPADSFDDRWEFDRHKSDMERYKDDVEEHLSCFPINKRTCTVRYGTLPIAAFQL